MTYILRCFLLCLVTMVFLVSCATTPGKERGKVVCPACDTEFDALYEKRF